MKKVAKMGVMSKHAITEVKETKARQRQTSTKSKSIRGIPKLVDTNAGTAKSANCTLIFCEEIQQRQRWFLVYQQKTRFVWCLSIEG